MAVRCPYCQHSIELRGAHPGRFTPKCPGCQHRFVLVVPEDADMPPLVGEMPAGQTAHGTVAGAPHVVPSATPSPTVVSSRHGSVAGATHAPQDVQATRVTATVAPPPSNPTASPPRAP